MSCVSYKSIFKIFSLEGYLLEFPSLEFSSLEFSSSEFSLSESMSSIIHLDIFFSLTTYLHSSKNTSG